MIVRLITWLCVRWFKFNRWQIPKRIPESLRRYVLVVAPHTSNIDFFIGLAARKLMNLDVKFMAKKELFVFPVKQLLLNLGGFAIDRSKKSSLVDQMVENFHTKPGFAITVTPEGTRSKVGKWKTGFYHIARNASVPVILVGFDYQKRWVVVSDPFEVSGNMESDFEVMHRFFKNIVPKHPHKTT